MILIIGGSGNLGRATVKQLLKNGEVVRVMTRAPEKVLDLQARGVDVVQGDLLDKASLVRACRGAEKVLASAHSILGRGKEASKYVDLQGHKDLIDAAKAAGVKHFVYVSVYEFDPIFRKVPFFAIKYQVENYLRASGLSYAILRPTAFMESHAERFIGLPILETGKVSLFGPGQFPRNFVAAADVAKIAVLALSDESLHGQTINIGGPENPTNMDVVRLYEQVAGRPAKVSHVPLAMLKVMYRLMRPLHPGLSQIMQFSVYADAADSTFDPAAMLARFPMELTRLEDFVAGRAAAQVASQTGGRARLTVA
jgi:uncharacterized protein YbjT (DUF2867 family)